MSNSPYYDRQSRLNQVTSVDLIVPKPDGVSFAFVGLPTGLTDGGSGTVSGTPTVAKSFNVTSTVDGRVETFKWHVALVESKSGARRKTLRDLV